MRFVLASASPARKALLLSAGVRPEVIVSEVDEDVITGELGKLPTRVLVQRLAEAKASAVASDLDGQALVLGCDSMLELDGEPLGKPDSIRDAMERWHHMRGRSGILHTGHCLIEAESGRGIVTSAAT